MNATTTDYERLSLLFRRTHTLPELHGAVYKLIHAIDAQDSSIVDLERIISSDPYLTASLLRVAAATVDLEKGNYGTLRHALMRLGFRTVRSMAVSILLQSLVNKHEYSNGFDPALFSRHSLFVGFMARYLFARRHQTEPFESSWSADEVFAGGLLHDLALGLLAYSTPEVYTRLHLYAERRACSMENAFREIYGGSMGDLGATAAESWRLPPVFVKILGGLEQPWEHQEEYTALCCLNYAHYLAQERGITLCQWEVSEPCAPEVLLEVRFPDGEIKTACDIVERHTNAYVEGPETAVAA